MSIAKAYVYFEYQPKTEEFDEELTVVPVSYDENCPLSYDISEGGFLDEWCEGLDLQSYPRGYYEVEYEWELGREYEEGYLTGSYPMICGFISMRRSYVKARALELRNELLFPIYDFLRSIFEKRWGVDVEYGGIGHGSKGLWLPQALWRRVSLPWRKELPWGPDYTAIYIRRY